MDVAVARSLLLTRDSLRARGIESRALDAQLRSRTLWRLHPGRYVFTADTRGLTPEELHLLHVVAVDSVARGGPAVYSHLTAAVLWGLPVARRALARVHVSGGTTRGVVQSKRGVSLHEVAVTQADTCVRHGMPTTTLARTVMDVIRSVGAETAIGVADAALRLAAWDEAAWSYNATAAEELRAELRRRAARAAGGRGIRLAREIIEIADGRAQLPGESISRLYLLQLGFRDLRLQVRIPAPDDGSYYADIAIDDVSAWYEYDGEAKYVDPAMTGGQDARVVLDEEKRREDWLRMTTGRPVVRAQSSHIATVDTLAAHLRDYGIVPPLHR